MKKCPNCNGEVKDTAKFCKHCGNKIEQKAKEIYCEVCGAKLDVGSTFCDECGAKIGDVQVANSDPWADVIGTKDTNANPWDSFKDSQDPFASKSTAQQDYQSGLANEQKQDFAKAFFFFKKSAEKGNVDAQKKLFDYYNKGTGGVEDKKLALDWIQKAAEQGDADAMCKVGTTYMNGFYKVRKEDPAKGYPWIEKAYQKKPKDYAWVFAEVMIRVNPFNADKAANIALQGYDKDAFKSASYIYYMAAGLTGDLISKLEFGKLSADYERLSGHQQYCKKMFDEWQNK